jgi:hypothetical protein
VLGRGIMDGLLGRYVRLVFEVFYYTMEGCRVHVVLDTIFSLLFLDAFWIYYL